MVQFQIVSGKLAGLRWMARRFPVRIGRSVENDLRLEEPGVWDFHAELNLDPHDGFVLSPQPEAMVTVNRQTLPSARLRHGDSIEIGSVHLRFWLAETRQRGLRAREWFVWVLVAALSLGQIALIYRLLP